MRGKVYQTASQSHYLFVLFSAWLLSLIGLRLHVSQLSTILVGGEFDPFDKSPAKIRDLRVTQQIRDFLNTETGGLQVLYCQLSFDIIKDHLVAGTKTFQTPAQGTRADR